MLVAPKLVTNTVQALRQGWQPAVRSIVRFRLHIVMLILFIGVSAPFARILSPSFMYLTLGLPIAALALWQLSGRPLQLPIHRRRRAEALSGVIGGLYGGISGIWGPPLIVYLLSTDTPKHEQVRVQGVVFMIGAVTLTAAHLATGVLNAQTVPLSLLMVPPGMAGMVAGFALQDRMDIAQFRRWTQVLLVLTALNLVRRGLAMAGAPG